MTRNLFDLGQRLRAAHTGQPVEIAAYAPVLPPVNPIACEVDTDGEHIYLTAASDTATATGADRAALAALAALGADLTAPHRTLVVGTAREAGLLASLAHQYRGDPAAAVVGWWDQRIDYPGTEAVHVVTEAARRRWVLGVHPDRERETATWREWLGVTGTGPQALLTIARMTASGSTLLDLLSAARADADSWERHQKRITAGRDWWMPDSRIDAAMGLVARSHAAEWYESLRMNDPRVALASAHDGSVVPGTVVAVTDWEAIIEADQPLSRLRVDSAVEAWRGEPIDAGGGICLNGRVQAATIDTNATLRVTVGRPDRKIKGIDVGSRLCLRPASVDSYMQANGRSLMAAKLFRGSNWIAGRGAPVARRGTVPLDVVVAAASD
jgi:hypothetical protein